MKKFSATWIFPGNQPPLKNGILVCEDDGTVLELVDTKGNLREQPALEHYSGIIVPGFINAHCHLEISHLKGKIPEKTGLPCFLGCINSLRKQYLQAEEEAMKNADFQMKKNGIVAVGDVANSWSSVKTKRESQIFYHTFVEAFGFLPLRADKVFFYAETAETMFRESGLSASVTPHAPYSVSKPLFQKISKKAFAENSVLSVHNQESADELAYFKDGSGGIARHIREICGPENFTWNPSGNSSLEYILSFVAEENLLLLVHNTFTSSEDIRLLKQRRQMENTFMVLCPTANLYIENRLPPVSLFQKENLNICLGTDSLASNHSLSILREMILLQNSFPDIILQELITWACLNGSLALGLSSEFGSFEPGKKPGINLITGADLHHQKLTGNSKIKRLL